MCIYSNDNTARFRFDILRNIKNYQEKRRISHDSETESLETRIGATLYFFGSAWAPPSVQLSNHNVVKEVSQISFEIRIQKYFDGTFSILSPQGN